MCLAQGYVRSCAMQVTMMWCRTVAIAGLLWFAIGCSSNAKSPGLDAAIDGRTADALRVDGALNDAAIDAPAASMLGPVDCGGTRTCPGISSCSVTAPGGVCNGCGSDTDCPTGTTCGQAGACVRDCTTDAQCSAGKRCNTQGLCVLRACSAQVLCPAPYDCSGNFCRRPACGPGNTCPGTMTCAAGVCIEPL